MATSSYSNPLRFAYLLIIPLVALMAVGAIFKDSLTYRDVPISILFKALEDGIARNALLTGRKKILHWRLGSMGVEEDIKAFYRPKIRDEIELDRFIHQIFYDNTGYVGESYFVNSQGKLQFKKPPDTEFNQWYQLASKVGLVAGSRIENNTLYVIGAQGAIAPYKTISATFPLEKLRQMEQVHE